MGNILCVPGVEKTYEEDPGPRKKRRLRHWFSKKVLKKRSALVDPLPVSTQYEKSSGEEYSDNYEIIPSASAVYSRAKTPITSSAMLMRSFTSLMASSSVVDSSYTAVLRSQVTSVTVVSTTSAPVLVATTTAIELTLVSASYTSVHSISITTIASLSTSTVRSSTSSCSLSGSLAHTTAILNPTTRLSSELPVCNASVTPAILSSVPAILPSIPAEVIPSSPLSALPVKHILPTGTRSAATALTTVVCAVTEPFVAVQQTKPTVVSVTKTPIISGARSQNVSDLPPPAKSSETASLLKQVKVMTPPFTTRSASVRSEVTDISKTTKPVLTPVQTTSMDVSLLPDIKKTELPVLTPRQQKDLVMTTPPVLQTTTVPVLAPIQPIETTPPLVQVQTSTVPAFTLAQPTDTSLPPVEVSQKIIVPKMTPTQPVDMSSSGLSVVMPQPLELKQTVFPVLTPVKPLNMQTSPTKGLQAIPTLPVYMTPPQSPLALSQSSGLGNYTAPVIQKTTVTVSTASTSCDISVPSFPLPEVQNTALPVLTTHQHFKTPPVIQGSPEQKENETSSLSTRYKTMPDFSVADVTSNDSKTNAELDDNTKSLPTIPMKTGEVSPSFTKTDNEFGVSPKITSRKAISLYAKQIASSPKSLINLFEALAESKINTTVESGKRTVSDETVLPQSFRDEQAFSIHKSRSHFDPRPVVSSSLPTVHKITRNNVEAGIEKTADRPEAPNNTLKHVSVPTIGSYMGMKHARKAAEDDPAAQTFARRPAMPFLAKRHGVVTVIRGRKAKESKKKVSDFKVPRQPIYPPEAPLVLRRRRSYLYHVPNIARAEAREKITWRQVDRKGLRYKQHWSPRSPSFDVGSQPLGKRLLERYGSIKEMQRSWVIPQAKQIEQLKLEHSLYPGLRVFPSMRGSYSVNIKTEENITGDSDEESDDSTDETNNSTRYQDLRWFKSKTSSPTSNGPGLSRWSRHADLSTMFHQSDKENNQ